jgi:DHA1 family bicyclomycin/chloramphenicol resistance-like MFS transporter
LTSTSRSEHRLPGWLILIGAMTAVGPVSIDMYLPGFSMIESELAEQGVARTMASYLIGIALGQLIYGPISDRYGRKPPLYLGFALYSLGALGCVFASSMNMLMVMRVVQALGACGGMVIGRAIIRDRCQPHEAARAFTMLMMIVSLGPVLAPTLGGWIITGFGWRAVFVFQCLFGVGLLIAMHSMMSESRDPAHVVPLNFMQVSRSYGRLLTDRVFVGYSLVGGFGMGALFCYVTAAPTVLMPLYQLSPQHFGWLLGLNGFAFMSASRINMLSLRRRGPLELVARAIWMPILVAVAFWVLALSLALPFWMIVVLQFSFFISVARVTPHCSALALAPYGREAGSASAMMGSLQSLIATFAGVAVAVFSNDTVSRLALLLVGGAIASGLSFAWTGREKAEQVSG